MALSARDRRALILGGAALGLIAGYVLAVAPLWRWYDSLVGHHGKLAADVARTVFNQRKADFYRTRITEMETRLGELCATKPYSEQMTAVGEKIITAAQESGFELKGSTPTEPAAWAEDQTLQMGTFLIDGEAGWENVFKFVAGLYRVPGVLSVEQMDLSSDPKKGGKINVKLTVSFLVKATPRSEGLWADRNRS